MIADQKEGVRNELFSSQVDCFKPCCVTFIYVSGPFLIIYGMVTRHLGWDESAVFELFLPISFIFYF